MSKKYVIVKAGVLEELVSKVNVLIDEGYIPIGGVAVSEHEQSQYSQNKKQYTQAMILRNSGQIDLSNLKL